MNKNKGFSLVELIVVITIMAILGAVLTPAYLRYIEDSRESKDLANVSSALLEVQAAVISNDHTATGLSGEVLYQQDGSYRNQVSLSQVNDGWGKALSTLNISGISYADSNWLNEPQKGGTAYVYYQDGEYFIDWGGKELILNNSNSIAKYVLNVVQKDLAAYISESSSSFASVYSKANSTYCSEYELPNGKKVNLIIYNRDYNDYQDIKTRLATNTASLIYNRATNEVSTIIYYDGNDYTSWSLTNGEWLDNNYVTKL